MPYRLMRVINLTCLLLIDLQIRETKWRRIVFDEAHLMKNGKGTLCFERARELKCNMMWLVTGMSCTLHSNITLFQKKKKKLA